MAELNILKQNLKIDPVNFLSLPDVVKSHVCQFLDTSSYMNIRLTCKDFKSVVEQATILERFPIKVSSSKQLQRVLESQVPFNNFVLNFKSLDQQTYLPEFAHKFGAVVRHLCITTGGGSERTILLLAKCTQLKELDLKTINISTYQKHDSFETILSSIRGLRKLSIHELDSDDDQDAGHNEIKFFLKVLNNCKHLVEFKIPAISSYNQKLDQSRIFHNEVEDPGNVSEEDWEQEAVQDSIHDPFPEWDVWNSRDILIHPILDFIRMKTNLNLSQIERINVQGITLFLWTTFKDLLKTCHENGVNLVGIQSSQFVHIKNEVSVLNPKYVSVIKAAQLTCIQHGFPLSMLGNLTELKVFINPGHFAGLREISDLNFPHLKHLRVQFIFSVKDFQSQDLIKKLFKECKRPTVQRLQLDWCLHENCSTISARDLVNSMRYIRELEINSWDAVDADFSLLWTNLQELEKITIKDCKNITNKAFVGDFNLNDGTNVHLRPLNQLKKLKSLTIRDISGKVNELAFMGSFRWIKLRRFEFESTVIQAIREEVYRSLMMAPLGMYVEYFVAPRPYLHSPFMDRRTFVQGFKNLKQRVFW